MAFQAALRRFCSQPADEFSREDVLISDTLRKNPAKYRPHRPHRYKSAVLREIYVVDTFYPYRQQIEPHRPPPRVSTANRLHRLPAYWRKLLITPLAPVAQPRRTSCCSPLAARVRAARGSEAGVACAHYRASPARRSVQSLYQAQPR